MKLLLAVTLARVRLLTEQSAYVERRRTGSGTGGRSVKERGKGIDRQRRAV